MNPLRRTAITVGLAVLPLDLVIAYAIGAKHPGYDHASQFMSELGAPGSPFAAAISVWWILYGVALIVAGLCTRPFLGMGISSRAFPWVLCAIGLTLGIGTGLFRCDLGCVAVSPSGRVHEALGLIGSIALLSGPILCWRLVGSRAAMIVFTLLLLLFSAQVAAGAGSAALAAQRGALQRAFLGIGYLWIAGVLQRALRAPATGIRND